VPKLEILYKYTIYSVQVGRSTISEFCRKHYPSKRKKTIASLIKSSKDDIIFGPRLFVLQDVIVEFIPYQGVPTLNILKEKKKNSAVFNCMATVGSFSLISFERNKNLSVHNRLTYAESTVPSFQGQKKIIDIDPTTFEPEELPAVQKPLKWDDLDWRIYYRMNDPNKSSSRAARDLHVSYKTVLNRLYRIQEDCTIWMPFFPKGYKNYRQSIITLKTKYEMGMKKELEKIDRSSYIYKIGDKLMLHLFLDEYLDLNFLLDLEKNGVIHSVSVSTPRDITIGSGELGGLSGASTFTFAEWSNLSREFKWPSFQIHLVTSCLFGTNCEKLT